MPRVLLLLGSNIEPEIYLQRAVSGLSPWVRLAGISPVYETPAVGSSGPNFLNAAVLGETTLDAAALKNQVLRPLEARLGRVRRSDKNAPRTIDVDILLWGDQILDPTLAQYPHIAVPAAALLPTLHPTVDGETLQTIAQRFLKASPIRLRTDVILLPEPS